MKVKYFGLLTIAVAASLAGCAAESAYVQRPYAIDREHADFPLGPELKAGSTVTVCYAKSSATPQAVRKLADDECGRFGLGTAFIEQTLSICPLMTPVAAIFKCAKTGVAGSTSPGQVGNVPMMPAFSAPGAAIQPSAGIGAADVSTTAKSAPFPVFLFNKGTAAQ